MSAKTPTVRDGWLYNPATPGTRIRLDTPAWVSWLEAPTTTSFSYPLDNPDHGYIEGVMTVRKDSRRRGQGPPSGGYWSVYRRCRGMVQRVYVGSATAVTHARLQTIADALFVASAGSAASISISPSALHA